MSATTVTKELHDAQAEILDPGNAGTIAVNRSMAICNLISAGAETRTWAAPTREGVVAKAHFQTDGGDITITFATAFNEFGDTTFVFSDEGQYATFESFLTKAGVLFWRMTSSYLTSNLAKLTATVTELNQQLHVGSDSEVVIAARVLTAADHGKTLFLTLATGFQVTLPAPVAGWRSRMIVAIAPTTAYVIQTTSSANILYGMTEERAGTAGVAGAAKNTFNFVANQSAIADWVEFFCDGTNFYYHGMTNVAAGNTVA